jgi:hypothetical protein
VTGECLILCVAGPGKAAGQYLLSYDPEAAGGFGVWAWTADPALAMVFPGAPAAFRCWRAVPANHPVRQSDGKPNRPLTAFSVTFVPAPRPDGEVREGPDD